FLPSPTQSVIVDHLVPELVSTSSTPPSSLLFSIPPPMSYAHSPAPSAIDDDFELTFTPPAPSVSSIDIECLHSPVTPATDCQSESEPASTSESSVSKFGLSPCALPPPPDQKLDLPPKLPPQISMFSSLPVSLSPDQSFRSLSFKSEALGQSSGSCELVSSTLVSAADVVTLSHPELPLSSPGGPIPFLLTSFEAPPNAPCSTPPQRPPRIKTLDSDSSPLEVTPAPASPAIPFAPQSQELPTVHEVSLTLAPHSPLTSPPLTLSHSGLAYLNFAFVFVTTAVPVSILLDILATLPTFAHKYWSKQEDIGNNRIGTFKTSKSSNTFAHRLRLRQLTPRAPRLVFDPGGPALKFKFQTAVGTRRRSPAQVEDTQ
ncbi:hypothetical protein EDB85DRAFT_2195206, partial [Lactarius pseudohatsudake]